MRNNRLVMRRRTFLGAGLAAASSLLDLLLYGWRRQVPDYRRLAGLIRPAVMSPTAVKKLMS